MTPGEVQIIYSGELPSTSQCSNIFCDGENVGIGTDNTQGYKLAIAGKTITEEIKVSLVQNWPDYVFENHYHLRSLEEVEQHINEKGHLPEIPSEEEVYNDGIELGQMNAKLLQKIEELTLYLIEQKKLLDEANRNIETLQGEVSALKNQ